MCFSFTNHEFQDIRSNVRGYDIHKVLGPASAYTEALVVCQGVLLFGDSSTCTYNYVYVLFTLDLFNASSTVQYILSNP